jgi:mRNA interferase RelE/StbE
VSDRYEIALTPSARRALHQLPARITTAVVVFLAGPLAENPHRVGKPLRVPLEGCFSARLHPYRVVYEIDEGKRTVTVLRIEPRADVYRS